MKEIARNMKTLIDDSIVKFIHWRSYVVNNEDVIAYFYDLIKGLEKEPVVEDNTTTTTTSQQHEKSQETPWRQISMNCPLIRRP